MTSPAELMPTKKLPPPMRPALSRSRSCISPSCLPRRCFRLHRKRRYCRTIDSAHRRDCAVGAGGSNCWQDESACIRPLRLSRKQPIGFGGSAFRAAPRLSALAGRASASRSSNVTWLPGYRLGLRGQTERPVRVAIRSCLRVRTATQKRSFRGYLLPKPICSVCTRCQ